MSLSDGLSMWPWWLWILSALWVGSLLFWQTSDTLPRERWAWGALALVYAALILISGRMVPATSVSAAPSSSAPILWLLWIGVLLFLGSAVLTLGLQRPRWQQWAVGGSVFGAGIALAALHAPEAALACGVAGVASVRKSVLVPVWKPRGAIPRQNRWLAGLTGVVTLVVMVGAIRHALLVEATYSGPSRWQTVFPTAGQIARQRSIQNSTENTKLPWEWWGLGAVTVLAAFTPAVVPRAETTTPEHFPS